MEYGEIAHFKNRLMEREQYLTAWLKSGASVAGDEMTKVRELLNQIRKALERIEHNTFGICKVCDGNIETSTLETRPETEVCDGCIEGEAKVSFEDDLRMAGKIQQALLPQTVPDIRGFQVAAKWLPANQVGGDYYDFLPCGGDEGARIVVADAMGKGVSAGIVMSNLQGALRVLCQDIHSPGQLVTKLNHWLCRNVPVTNFVSMLCVCLEETDADETTLTYVNAGHPMPILVRKDGRVKRLDVTGGILGVHEGFLYSENKVAISKGDLLFLYTDGVTEITNSNGDMFEDDLLIEFIRAQCRKPFDDVIENLLEELAAFCGDPNGLDDDLTIVTLLKD